MGDSQGKSHETAEADQLRKFPSYHKTTYTVCSSLMFVSLSPLPLSVMVSDRHRSQGRQRRGQRPRRRRNPARGCVGTGAGATPPTSIGAIWPAGVGGNAKSPRGTGSYTETQASPLPR